LIKAWTLRRPDVVHIATEGPLGWSALQAAKVLKLPVTSDFRTNFHSYSKHYGVGWLRKPIVAYLRKFHNATACTMVPTQALRAELLQHGFLNLKVVARGVDTQLFNPAKRSEALRSTWQAKPETVVLISVGRLAAEKNLGQVMATYEALKSVGADVRLVLVGDGPLRETIHQRCPDAIFAGMLTHDTLASYYASADMFLFPSQSETFGNVTVEALASGLPVLAFDCAAATDWVKPDLNGWLIPESQPEMYVTTAVRVVQSAGTLAQVAASTRARWGSWIGKKLPSKWKLYYFRPLTLRLTNVLCCVNGCSASVFEGYFVGGEGRPCQRHHAQSHGHAQQRHDPDQRDLQAQQGAVNAQHQ